MKTDFSINVQVNLGVTPELVQLVSAILSHKPTNVQSNEALLVTHAQVEEKPEEAAPAAPQQPTTKRGRKKKEPTDTKGEPSKEAAEDEQQEAAANQADANDAVAENTQAAEQAPQGEAEQPKELTEEDVRAAMHSTRQRIEGEDYKEHTDSDAYKKYHKALTAQFKNIAALLGADKPSALPVDKRADFIEQCKYLKIMEDGTIGNDCPF
mgnify:CR=1 FL=1